MAALDVVIAPGIERILGACAPTVDHKKEKEADEPAIEVATEEMREAMGDEQQLSCQGFPRDADGPHSFDSIKWQFVASRDLLPISLIKSPIELDARFNLGDGDPIIIWAMGKDFRHAWFRHVNEASDVEENDPSDDVCTVEFADGSVDDEMGRGKIWSTLLFIPLSAKDDITWIRSYKKHIQRLIDRWTSDEPTAKAQTDLYNATEHHDLKLIPSDELSIGPKAEAHALTSSRFVLSVRNQWFRKLLLHEYKTESVMHVPFSRVNLTVLLASLFHQRDVVKLIIQKLSWDKMQSLLQSAAAIGHFELFKPIVTHWPFVVWKEMIAPLGHTLKTLISEHEAENKAACAPLKRMLKRVVDSFADHAEFIFEALSSAAAQKRILPVDDPKATGEEPAVKKQKAS